MAINKDLELANWLERALIDGSGKLPGLNLLEVEFGFSGLTRIDSISTIEGF